MATPIYENARVIAGTLRETSAEPLTALAQAYEAGFTVPLVTDRDAWDSSEVVDSIAGLGAFMLQIEGVCKTDAQHWVWLRFNEAKPTDAEVDRAGWGQIVSAAPAVLADTSPNRSSIIVTPDGIALAKWAATVTCVSPGPGKWRQFFAVSHYWSSIASNNWYSLDTKITWKSDAELSSIGIGCNSVNLDKTTTVTFKRL